ncbi:MAG: hypothetical protein Q8R53_05775 [Nanoarchaeota archaeon]|nr:hypothetical protein [Nanoarchaeota archaeon]
MDVKRGILILVVLLVLSSAGVVAFQTFPIIVWHGQCDADGCNPKEVDHYFPSLLGAKNEMNNDHDSSCDTLDWEEWPKSPTPPLTGCYFEAVDLASGTFEDDVCAWSIAPSGNFVTSEAKRMDGQSNVDNSCPDGDQHDNWYCADGNWEEAEGVLKTPIRSNGGRGLLCNGFEGLWYQCDATVIGQTTTLGEGEEAPTYICLSNAVGSYEWADVKQISETLDSDADGVPNALDCGPYNGDVFGKYPVGCGGDSGVDCLFGADAQESCDDGIDNDCSAWNGNSMAIYLYANVNDDCDLPEYEAACEASPVNGDWLSSSTGNNCCGDDGLADLGTIAENTEVAGRKAICLSQDKSLVGFDDEAAAGILGAGTGWKWVDAPDGAFKIFTINKAYDVVSNGAQWYACNATNEGSLDPTPSSAVPSEGETYDTLVKTSNRFFCYDEGNYWSWAECVAERSAAENSGVKVREKGQGLFTLPVLPEEATAVSIAIDAYSPYYGEDQSFPLDFTGYEFLNFQVQFVPAPGSSLEDHVPFSLFLEIYGPDEELYFRKDVLGDIVSRPPFEVGKFLHVTVPIAPFFGVTSLVIRNDQDLPLMIKDLYLSSGDQEFLCSGEASATKNVWIENIDHGAGKITGEEICIEQYGNNAWLGDDDDVEEAAANCCGNNGNGGSGEYYAGASRENADGNNYACWNSQAIAEKEAITNVEFEATFTNDPVSPAGADQFLREDVNVEVAYTCDEISTQAPATGEIDTSVFNIVRGSFPWFFSNYLSERENKKVLAIGPDPIMPIFKVYAGALFCDPNTVSAQLTNLNSRNTSVYFFNKNTNRKIGSSISPGDFDDIDDVEIIAELTRAGLSALQEQRRQFLGSESETKSFTYPCNATECLLPLPHATTFVANKHPGLYDLYLITMDPETEEVRQTLVDETGSEVIMPAILKAVNVPQQVVFISDEQDIGFYGCEAPQYITATEELEENVNFCSPKAGQICAPSSIAVGGVPSWSAEDLQQIGYADTVEIPTSVSELLMKPDPEITEEEKAALGRIHQASVLPGRNFLPNAEFSFVGNEVPGWTLFSSRPLREVFSSEKAELRSGEVLRSERLAVPSGVTLDFSAVSLERCPVQFFLSNTDGDKHPQTVKRFSTGTNSFVVVEFSGPAAGKLSCTIENPLLQIVDDLDPAAYDTEDSLRDQPLSLLRQGQACCPNNYCWNGFTCVAPMEDSPLLAEPVGEDRHYRCIAGEWTYQPKKTNWRGVEGFCSAQNECFVSSEGSSAVTAPQLFANGYGADFPNCINDGEVLIDNYCQEGNWMSRTQAVAGRLFEVADGKEYVLYCTDYQTALVTLDVGDLYPGGDPNQFSSVPSCFSDLNSQLSPEENKCINNVCILQYKEGNEWKTAFATTVNKPITDENSFLNALGVNPESCTGSASGFVKCTVDGADVWYAQDLQAVAYAREEIDLSGAEGFSFDALLGRLDANARDFMSSVKNFRDLYLLNKECQGLFSLLQPDCKRVRAVKELGFDEEQEVTKTLKAEYEGFDTPICEYVDKRRVAYPDFQRPLPFASGEEPLRCFVNGDVQKVKAVTGADFLWPQLTGKLRVAEE